MKPYRCNSPTCRNEPEAKLFHLVEDEQNKPSEDQACPVCGLSQGLLRLSVIHLLIPDPKGPVKSNGPNQLLPADHYRYKYGCQEWNDLVAKDPTMTPRHVTGERAACTCYGCLQNPEAKAPAVIE